LARLLFLVVFLAFTGPFSNTWADSKPTSTPTESPTPSGTLTPTATPMSTVVAPSSAPSSASLGSYKPEPKHSKSKWFSLTDLGVALPLSPNMSRYYGIGFNVDICSGYQFSDNFSGLLDVGIDHFDSRNAALTGDNNLTMVALSFLARYTLNGTGLSPYVFLGPGAVYNENRSNNTDGYDPYTNNFNFPVNGYNVNFLAEGGLGLEYHSADGFALFLQSKLICDFVTADFAAKTFTDSPNLLWPIQLGFSLGI